VQTRREGVQPAFGVDVAFGDPILGEPEVVVAEDVLAFAGIAPPTLRLYPIESHIAEKLHAYSMPRNYPNSRVKDFPDIALLATVRDRSDAIARFVTALEGQAPCVDATAPALWAARLASLTNGAEPSREAMARAPLRLPPRQRRLLGSASSPETLDHRQSPHEKGKVPGEVALARLDDLPMPKARRGSSRWRVRSRALGPKTCSGNG